VLFCLIIAELEQFVIPGADLEMPLPRLKPLLFYFLHLIFRTLPQERPRSFGIGVTGIAIDFKIIQQR
jgi:hypothetical protein